MSNQEKSKYHVPNLERALKIIELLADHHHGMSSSDIASTLEIPVNSAFRITMTLYNNGYLERCETSKKFSLSRKLLSIGYTACGEGSLIELSIDVMRELRDKVKETVLVGSILDNQGVVVENLTGLHPFSFVARVGTRFNLHTAAPGKAIMAYLPERELNGLLDSFSFEKFNERTITSKAGFIKELDFVKEHGYGIDRAEEFDNCHCIAAPIFNHGGHPIAAIWVTGPASRLKESNFEQLGKQVIEAAEKISKKMGYKVF
ncbi:IclR family transcriptional regulator [Lentisphaerota bacterium WC36G]|nr:IclR family transcriptional regulator [Lentisphaerae bacterium WC36]